MMFAAAVSSRLALNSQRRLALVLMSPALSLLYLASSLLCGCGGGGDDDDDDDDGVYRQG